MARGSAAKRKPGRPALPVDKKRGSQLHILLRDDERDELDAAADRAELTLSAWIRRVLLRAAKRQR